MTKPTYADLKRKSLNINVIGKPQEVTFFLVASMCNNRNQMTFKLQEDGSYHVSAGRKALSNFSGEDGFDRELRWSASEGNWKEVAATIRRGYHDIEDIKVLGSYNKPKSLLEQAEALRKSIYDKLILSAKANHQSISVEMDDIYALETEIVKIRSIRNKLVPLDEDDNQCDIEDIPLLDLAKLADRL